MEKFVKYKPLGSDVEIDFQTALGQAAYLLDIAAKYATENKDIKKLIKIADTWVNIGFAMTATDEDEEEEHQMGFGFDMSLIERREVMENGPDDED